jgi:hypothetical protein
MIRDRVVVNPTEPTPFGITDDLSVQGFIAPAHQVAHYIAPQRYLDGRGGSSIPSGLRSREQEIMGSAQHQLAIIE